METLYQLLTALISAQAPWWLLAIIGAGIVLPQVGPIRLNLSIGEGPKQTRRHRSLLPSPANSPNHRRSGENHAGPELPE